MVQPYQDVRSAVFNYTQPVQPQTRNSVSFSSLLRVIIIWTLSWYGDRSVPVVASDHLPTEVSSESNKELFVNCLFG